MATSMTRLRDARALMLADLSRSGLNAADARRLHCRPLATAATYGFNVPAYVLPYFGPRGKPIDAFRVRLLRAPATFRKPPKYVQPARSAPRAYLPPYVDWVAIARDPARPVWLTEGEKKAAAATKAGVDAIGLGGVWSWRSAKRNEPFLPDLEAFAWTGRPTVLAFDSDAATNPQVAKALVALASALADRGADVGFVRLPASAGVKVGLDDYLVAAGVDAVRALAVERFDAVRALWELNAEFAVVHKPSAILSLSDGQLLAPRQFELRVAPRTHTLTAVGANGPTLRVVKSGKAWLEWPGRREHPAVTYAPGEPPVLADGAYNYWRPAAVEPVEPPGAAIDRWRRLRDYLFQAEPDAIAWFEKWAAYPLQRPGTKLYSAVLLHGARHGTGKSLLGMLIGACYGHNFGVVERDQLYQPFNAWCLNRQFILGDEITGSDRRRDADALKNLVTRPTIEINQKGLPQYTIADHLNYLLTSNHPDAVYLDDDDRRFFVVKVDAPPLAQAFYDEVDAWLRTDAAAHLLWYLTRVVDVAGFNPRARPPFTEAKAELQYHARSSVELWVHELLEAPDRVLVVDGAALPGDLWTAWDLAQLYDPAAARGKEVAVGRALAKAGAPQRHLGAVGRSRVYVVRNASRWRAAPTTELWRHYSDTRGAARFRAVDAADAAHAKF